MNKKYAQRPHFYEGQYLGADDFNDLHSYLNDKQRRHALGMHTWGVVAGLELTEKVVDDDTLIYLQPGYAVDGYGRSISVLTPCQISPELLCAETCGLAKVWLRLKEVGRIDNRPGFNTCCERDCFERIDEMFEIAVGAKAYLDERHSGIDVAGNHLEEPREVLSIGSENAPLVCDASVSYQQFPGTDEQPYWYIPIGMVRWDGSKLQARTPSHLIMSRAFRRQAGLVGESLFASNGLLRLRARTSPNESGQSADTVCNAQAIEAGDVRVSDDGGSFAFNELVWIEGDLRITGDARLFGTRLEFRKTDGTDVIDNDATPLYIRRGASNLTDLEVTLGRDGADQTARLVVGTEVEDGSATDIEGKFFVTAAGKVGIGTGKPSTSLHIAEGSDVTLEEDAGFLLLGKTSGRNIVMDDNKIQARKESAISILHLQADGGDVQFNTHEKTGKLVAVTDEGRIGIGTNMPATPLQITNGEDATVGNNSSGYLLLGETNEENIVLDNNEIQARDSGNASTLYLQKGGGDLRFGMDGKFHVVGSRQAGMHIIAGRISEDGTKDSGTGFTSFRTSAATNTQAAQYRINFDHDFTNPPIVVVSASDDSDWEDNIANTFNVGIDHFMVGITDGGTSSNSGENSEFNFIAIGI